jgi:hypothetical protein
MNVRDLREWEQARRMQLIRDAERQRRIYDDHPALLPLCERTRRARAPLWLKGDYAGLDDTNAKGYAFLAWGTSLIEQNEKISKERNGKQKKRKRQKTAEQLGLSHISAARERFPYSSAWERS